MRSLRNNTLISLITVLVLALSPAVFAQECLPTAADLFLETMSTVGDYQLPNEVPLMGDLSAAMVSFAKGDTDDSLAALAEFIDAVDRIPAKRLDPDAAAALIATAENLAAMQQCPCMEIPEWEDLATGATPATGCHNFDDGEVIVLYSGVEFDPAYREAVSVIIPDVVSLCLQVNEFPNGPGPRIFDEPEVIAYCHERLLQQIAAQELVCD